MTEQWTVSTTTSTPTASPDDLLTVDETADLLRVTPATLRRWVISGIGPRCKIIGVRSLRFRRGDVADYVRGAEWER